jgi:cytochrome c-type biogenesis protein
MTEFDVVRTMFLPIGLGLFGFIEPCSIGTTLLFIKSIEGQPARNQIADVTIFVVVRAFAIGLLGVIAALVGTVFLGFQRAGWAALGVLYAVLGILLMLNRVGFLMRTVGPSIAALSQARRPATLGLLFGLNIPACAAPLLLVLLGAAAAEGTSGATLARGFTSLALFGAALSLPLFLLVLFPRTRRVLDWLSRLSARAPKWVGLALVGLGLWSIVLAVK